MQKQKLFGLVKQLADIVPGWDIGTAEHFLTRDRFGVSLAKKYLRKQREDEASREDGDDAAPVSPGTRHLHELAHLVRRGTGASYSDALNYLLHNRSGRALARTFKQYRDTGRGPGKEFVMPSREAVLKGMVRASGGLDGLARSIIKQGESDIGESEFVKLVTEFAKAANPTLSDAQAFAKAFEASETLRRAHKVVQYNRSADEDEDDETDQERYGEYVGRDRRNNRDAQALRPQREGDGGESDDEEEGEGEAYYELQQKAAELRKRDGSLTTEQAFAKVYQDPANRALVMAERRHNGITVPRVR
jgi:hypothetical protein